MRDNDKVEEEEEELDEEDESGVDIHEAEFAGISSNLAGKSFVRGGSLSNLSDVHQFDPQQPQPQPQLTAEHTPIIAQLLQQCAAENNQVTRYTYTHTYLACETTQIIIATLITDVLACARTHTRTCTHTRNTRTCSL